MKERDVKKLLDIAIVAIGEFVEQNKAAIIDMVVAAINASESKERLAWDDLGLSTRGKNALTTMLSEIRKWDGEWHSRKTAQIIAEDEPPTRIECLQILERSGPRHCGPVTDLEIREKLTVALKQ